MKDFFFYLDSDFEDQIRKIFESMSFEYKIPGKKMGNFLISRIKESSVRQEGAIRYL